MEASDYEFAVSLQSQFFNEASQSTSKLNLSVNDTSKKSKSLIDPEWELIDPNPDIYVLFDQFNKQFFWNTLSMVEVKWSPRMTLCAGLCCYEGRGSLCSVRLSQPLLKLRPRKDLVETLLHEMIHAYLFVTENNKDRDGHGPEFCKHMRRINAKAGTNITIYHSFHDEVDEMRKHWWRCTGGCRRRPPFFGYVKRAMNRQPSKNDYWWNDHQKSCGGDFVKIKEPENYGKKPTNTAERKAKKNADSTPDPTQRTLSFSPLSSIVNRGQVLGGTSLSRDGARGIPSSSRLLSLYRDQSNEVVGSGSRRPPKSVVASTSQSKPWRNSGNLSKVCQELRRTGGRSVNEGAPAYRVWKVKTKFLATKRSATIVFESDDELGDDYVLNSDIKHNKSLILTEDGVLHDKPNTSNHTTTRDESRNGVKRKFNVVNSQPSCGRSPLKKKLNLNVSTSESFINDQTDRVSAPIDFESTEKPSVVDSTESIALDFDRFLIDREFWSPQEETESPSPVSCPICSEKVPYDDINTHIDICLNVKAIEESSF